MLAAVLVVAGAAAGVTLAAFSATTSNPTSSFSSKRVYAGNRTTSAWVVEDAADGSAADATQDVAVVDGTLYATGNWGLGFASNRFVDFRFNSPLPAGVSAAGVVFNVDLRSNSILEAACFYVEVYRA